MSPDQRHSRVPLHLCVNVVRQPQLVITRGKPPGIWALTLTLTLQNPYPRGGVRVLEGFEGVLEGFGGFEGFEGFLHP